MSEFSKPSSNDALLSSMPWNNMGILAILVTGTAAQCHPAHTKSGHGGSQAPTRRR